MKKFLSLRILLLCGLVVYIISSCSKDDDDNPDPVTLVKHWEIALSAKLENPAPAGRTETGSAVLDLYSDNSMDYHIMVNNLAAGDALTASHIHFGDAITNGPVILNFNPTFTGNMATGKVTDIPTSLRDSILTQTVYVNVHSTQVGSGLARGQMDKTIDFAVDVNLDGANEVEPVTTTATGVASLRLATDKTLYSKVTVTGLEVDDYLTASHIHSGAVGVNGPVLQLLTANEAEFGVGKMYTLTDAVANSLRNDPVYVNAHSDKHAGGVIRGQIR